uniref:F-actin monooxygenase n=1 Tax=Stomoxys calcitrans TaxID=35570 RepID=A0A1I8PQY1_STOCA
MDYSGSPDMGLDLCGPGPIYYNCTVKSMSRSAHQRQQQKLQMQQQQLLAQQMADNEAAAAAAEMFDLFCVATTMRQILGLHRQMCDVVGLRPAPLNEFYPKLKTKVRSWKAQALWKKFDARASHRAYAKGNACTGTRVLVIGAGPCGLRTAIEAQLLGAKVVVVEKRDRISRNNVLHLWPFVITDLRNLGAKKFYGKFCAGSIDHISIRQLQCILLKVALLLGVEIHEGVSFDRTIEPSGDGCGWRAQVSPADHAVSHYEFDVLIGADGKRNTLEGFKRKEFRGKLAIAITANFINKKTEAEAKAEEISGVAFIFNQSFFKELYHTTGIDLENIVYYKDETHYFVMTAKKHSLIDKGVIMQDFADPAELLAPINVNTEKLLDYAREAAEFSTKYQMPNLEFAVNHYGKPDVAMFDFTSMFAAESSCRVIVRHGFRLLQCLVGDSLLEPFWPTGSGCARGFLSSMDAAYAIKLWANPANSTLGVMAQRESIYRLLGQTTPENLQRDTGGYTVDPATRYPNLNRTSVNVWQVKHLIDTDDKNILEQTFMDTNALQVTQVDTPVRRKRRSGDTMPLSAVLLRWICAQLHAYDFAKELKEVSDVFTNGKVLCALINRYRPDLVDFNAIKDLGPIEMNDLAFKILDKELHIPRIMSGKDAAQLNTIESKIWLNYLEQICEVFRGEIPHVKHPKIDFSDLREKYRVNYTHAQPDFSKLLQLSSKQKAKSPIEDAVDVPQAAQKRSVLDEEKLKRQRRHEQMLGAGNAATGAGNAAQTDTPRRAKKRRSAEKAANISTKVALAFKKQAASEKCHFCRQTVYLMEKLQTENLVMHRGCLKCHHCHTNLRLGAYAFDRDDPNGRFYCTQHYRLPAKPTRPVVRKPGQRKSAPQTKEDAAAATLGITPAEQTAELVVNSGDESGGDDPRTPEKRGPVDNVSKMDLLERGQTPERIEFENTDAMSDGEPSEEHIIDEHEWSGRNFLPESNNDSESDLSSSDESDTESNSDMYEEANDSPLGVQTLQLASEWIGKQNYSDSDVSDDNYDSSEGLADDGKDDTEGEDFVKAREKRREEVRLPPLPPNLPTDTETEVQSDSESSTSDELEHNSATEISTDSEFDNDELIRSAPKIFIDDTHLRKPTKVQVKSTIIPPSMTQNYNGANTQHKAISGAGGGTYLAKYQTQQQPLMPQFKPLVQVDPSLLTSNRTPLQNPRPGDYLLNKTASTEGIASKKSLELKKRYLLGEPANGNKIQKSGSTSVLDSRIRSFQSNISECQKLLNPSNEISPSMKTFLDRTKLGEKTSQELMRSATNNILNDLKVEITIQKASSTASTDNEKENVFVNSKNELNKCMEYSETVNAVLLDAMSPNKKSPATTPTNNKSNIIETVDLVTPEKEIDRDKSDSNKVIDLTGDSPDQKSNRTILENETKTPDVSKDVKQVIPDILGHIEEHKDTSSSSKEEKSPQQEDNNMEKADAPEKQQDQHDDTEVQDVQIEVPNIAWKAHNSDNLSSSSSHSTCSSHSSSLEDIEHFILESTTSPETHNSAIAMVSTTSTGTGHQVPRVEVHDSSGTLMQIDSLMIIDGKYVGDPEDLKYMEVPEGIIVPAQPALKTTELGDEHEADHEHEPVTATPEPIETTVIEVKGQREVTTAIRQEDDEEPPPLPENGPPLPAKGPPRVNPSMLKFDTRNENKIESLKNLPLIQDTSAVEQTKAVKPISLNLSSAQKPAESSPITSPLIDMDKTPTGDLLSRGSDSETEPTGTAQILTETELSDWTADDCISENFVDMDFVKSSHGKGKSHKKGKRKGNAATGGVSAAGRLPSTNEVMKELAKTAPVAEFEGILKSIDLDDIEFMDTGSDSSGTEPHSATNTALLRNRGYVEFVDQTTPKHLPNAPIKSAQPIVFSSNETYKPIAMKRDEKLGIDYIEQGAYIMHEDANKTPVNESKQVIGSASAAMTSSSIMTQSLTDSSTINDLEEDSTNSQIQMSSISRPANYSVTTAGGATTTTEESEALTVVSSPLDSSPHTPRNSSNKQREYATAGSTPSSTDQAPKSSQSSSQSGNNSGTSSSKTTPPRQSSKESTSPSVPMPGDRRSNDELSYEEYVRALQQKIVQISTTARGDSLEARKQRRKSSKGEATSGGSGLIAPNQQQHQTTVIEPATETNIRYDTKDQGPSAPKSQNTGTTTMGSTSPVITDRTKAAGGGIAAQPQVQKVPEIPTLTSKLEEITKERTKQKDLIHDLVMDKLQSKKQLNAEKRLHRSRQRSILTSGLGGTGSGGAICGYSSGSSLSPTPKLAAAATTTDTNCTNQAHYHVSTAANSTSPSARTAAATQRFLSNSSSFKENTPLPSSYVSTYGMEALSPTRANAYKQRPFSEHLEGDQFKAFEERYKINKTPSFSNVKGSQRTTVSQTSSSEITTPIPPLRQNKGRNGVATADAESLTRDSNFSTSTENLRSEARARARLKSNSELGLSPEEKMQLLRKRIQADYNCNNSKQVDMRPDAASYERQTSLRESKMSTSKSVNDLAYLSNSQKQNVQQIGSGTISHQTPTVRADFTSDPNILMSATSQQQQGAKPLSKNSSRRAKDPERRKSLIQSLTNFFHMGQGGSSSSKENKHHKDHAASEGNSAQSEHPGTTGGGANTVSGSHGGSNSSAIDGVLSRFRISPKSKDKSKSCTELRSSYIGQKDDYSYHGSGYSSPARRLRTSSVSMAALSSYEAPKKLHSSQDALTHSQHLSHSTYYSQSQLNTRPNNNHNGSNYHQQRIQGSIGSNGSGSHHHHHQQQHYHSQHQQHPSSTKHQLYTNNRKDMRSTHNSPPTKKSSSSSAILAFSSSSPQLCVVHKSQSMTNTSSSNAVAAPAYDDQTPPPIPPLPLNYQRSDDESYTTETRDQKKQRAISKAVRQAELKRLRIAQEIQREQEEIEVQLKELETRGVLIEKALRGEEQTLENLESTNNVGSNDEKLLKELLEIWRNITQLKKRDEELGIRQQELQLEHRHAQLKEELNMRLSCNKLDKSSADVAAEGAILNEMLEIVAKRAALRPSSSTLDLATTSELLRGGSGGGATSGAEVASGSGSSKIHLSSSSHGQSNDNEESNI